MWLKSQKKPVKAHVKDLNCVKGESYEKNAKVVPLSNPMFLEDLNFLVNFFLKKETNFRRL